MGSKQSLPRTITLCLMFLLALSVPESTCLAVDRESATLQVQLEDSVFLEGQTVYMIACLHNDGNVAIVDVAPLPPRMGYMRVDLMRKDTGEHMLRTMPIGAFRDEGATLGPGQVLCAVRDLTLYFGVTPRDSAGFASRIGSDYLPAGEYTMKWQYDLHTGNHKRIPQVTLVGELEFSVRHLASDPRELSLVSEFLTGLPRVGTNRSSLHVYARAWLPRFYGSKYLMRLYMATGTLLNDLDFDAIFDGVSQAGAPPERRAALLGIRLSMTDYRNNFDSGWRERTKRHVKHQLERDVLSIEPRRPQ